MITVKISSKPFELNTFNAIMENNSHGAVSIFMGRVRETNNNLPVSGIIYDCFIPIAEKTLIDICEEAKKEWGNDLIIFAFHRTGHLNVGETSVAIGVSSRHRKASLEASKYIINELKHRVPIWKEEIYKNGKRNWLDGCALQQS